MRYIQSYKKMLESNEVTEISPFRFTDSEKEDIFDMIRDFAEDNNIYQIKNVIGSGYTHNTKYPIYDKSDSFFFNKEDYEHLRKSLAINKGFNIKEVVDKLDKVIKFYIIIPKNFTNEEFNEILLKSKQFADRVDKFMGKRSTGVFMDPSYQGRKIDILISSEDVIKKTHRDIKSIHGSWF